MWRMSHSQAGSEQLWVPLWWAAGHHPQHCRTACPRSGSAAGNWALGLASVCEDSCHFGWGILLQTPLILGGWGSTPHSCLAAVVTLLSCTVPFSFQVKVEDAKIIMNPELVRGQGFPDLSAFPSPQNLFSQNYRTGQLLKCQATSSWSSHSLPQQRGKDNLSFNHILHKIYVFFPHRLVSDFSQYKLH